ncbi:MAG: bifunctional 4-hydroxy-2-oxoglutarate aldolase/2-dehydro-3-deoxy-phosphogluconate aldolase [Clostridiales bacterium]|nr:bifunctional 4-hydroxy-2-oxoglutarate aldolase/2-dehydro-3-deoxy-phosphogluconate aldolase [Clostridiales bacterium]
MCKKVIESILENKIVVIVRGVEKNNLIPLAQAMYDGGIRLLEITFDATGKISDKETAENIKMLSQYFEGKMYIGAGTVLTKEQVRLTKESGGKFIISPDINTRIIRYTKKLKLVSMPGALTPSEIQKAHRAGADFVKLFPISNMGSSYVKAVTAPLKHIKLIAVGGVDASNMAEFISAGVVGFGLGSNIVNHKLINDGNFAQITEEAKRCVNATK